MKHFCSIGLLALSALFAWQEPASAWVRFRFSAGVNGEFSYGGQGGVIFGFWKQGHPPADCPQPCFGGQHAGFDGGHGFHVYAPGHDPYSYAYAPQPAHPQAQAPPPPPAAAAAAPIPGYSNFYGQFYYHQPTSYTPDHTYRFGLNFGR